MASTVTELMMRRMGAKSGSSVDWESIARGMVDFTTVFDIPASVGINTMGAVNGFTGRKIRNLAISEGNTTLNTYCFSATTTLESVTFPSTLTTINDNAFSGCGLVSVTLPSTITTYKKGVFYNCKNLEEVIMEATTPPTVGTNMFQSCKKLTAIYVPDASVSAYQSASNWSTYASIIKPISQRPT